MESKKKLREELMNAELRATTHFEKEQELEKKFNRVWDVILNGEKEYELAVLTIQKIKKVLEN
ncbi:MAG: hypothetical protein U0L22_08155 [Bacteroidales bacterium]|nr:hypothetical protein [Bacteroidales bacterium]